jgi:hypothetical protein
MDNFKLHGAYYPPSDYERADGKHPQYDYSKNGQCDVHGAFNNHYKRNCPKCALELGGEEIDTFYIEESEALELALFDRAEARAINGSR